MEYVKRVINKTKLYFHTNHLLNRLSYNKENSIFIQNLLYASAKDVEEVYGEMPAGKPNENHKTFKGKCNDGLKCIKNKCTKTGKNSVNTLG